jgi:TonB family protein
MASDALNQRFLYVPRSALYASLAVHFGVLIAFITVQVLDHFNIHLFARKPPVKEMYQEYIQVDVVGLPQNLVKDIDKTDASLPVVDKPMKTTEENDQPKPAPPPPATMETPGDKAQKDKEEALKDAAKKQADAQKKKDEEDAAHKAKEKKDAQVARQKALKKLKDEASREAALKALSEKKGKAGRAKIAGNLLSKGTATTGMIGDARDRYGALVTQKIREHFNIFTWQKKKGLVAVVYIEIYPTGRVRQSKILKRSIDPTYDSAVLEAIDEAQPLPVPDDLSILDGGLTVEFRPEIPGG